MAGAAALLAACQVVPTVDPVSTGPAVTPTPEPSATALPSDETRHRIALLVPMSGNTGDVGQALANATTMALLDTSASNLRITTYDTNSGAKAAAGKALADGNKLILGPLLAENVPAVKATLANTNVPAVSFSNDTSVAGKGVFVMGHIPAQSIRRSVAYARDNGSNNFAVLSPSGDYGSRSFEAFENALSDFGGALVARENYDRGNTSIVGAAQRLRTSGGYDTVLIADSARLASQAAVELKRDGASSTRILGTELWSGEGLLTRAGGLEGAIYAAVSDNRFQRFSSSYETRFGSKPFRIASLGYDAVLLSLRVSRDWKVGDNFPVRILRNEDGFVGVDGAFRFGRDGVVQRALSVREVQNGRVVEVDPAPATFED